MTLPEMACGYPLPFHRSRTDANLPFLPRRAGLPHNMVVPYQSGAARDAHTSEWRRHTGRTERRGGGAIDGD